jgi:methionine synthase II (cobalamin-independent)
MRFSKERILTTHAGSLSRPADLIEMSRARSAGERKDDAAYARCLSAAVSDVVRRQHELGIDIPDDGEFGKPMAANYDYGAWWNYAFARMDGFSPAESVPESGHKKSSVAELGAKPIGERAREEVGGPAGGERHDQLDRPARIGLRRGRRHQRRHQKNRRRP